MKRYIKIFFLISVLFSTLVFESCLKKGPNDPFLSFRSRKARMTGEWVIKSYLLQTTTDYIDGSKYLYKLTSTDDNVAETKGFENYQGQKDTSWTWNGTIQTDRTFEFDKYGKVTYRYHYKISYFKEDEAEMPSWTNPNNGVSYWVDTTWSYERKLYNTGTWNFLNGIDDYKSKERISIMWEYKDFVETYNIKTLARAEDSDINPDIQDNVSSRKQTRSYYYNGESTEAWILDKLKNKEATMYRYIDNNYKENNDQAELENTSVKGYESYELEQE